MTLHAVAPITETQVVAELLGFLRPLDVFTIYEEVEGVPFVRLPDKDTKTFRVDFVLSPRRPLLDAGWRRGPIGIECKAPDVKIGKAAAQCRDYQHAVFEITPGFWIKPQWFFLHPFDLPRGDVESLMAADRVGVANWGTSYPSRAKRLRFQVGSYNMLELTSDGAITINGNPTPGTKAGSR